MENYKQVRIHWEIIEKYVVFQVMHLEIKCEDKVIGYYRIWHDPETESIAFYSGKEEHGVLPPQEYRAIPSNHKMIRYIEDDLNKMGYTIPDGHRRISDGMLLGQEKFPKDWDVWYERN